MHAEEHHSGSGIGRALASRLTQLDWADIPPHVIETTGVFVLDTLGVIAGAARAPGIPELNSALQAWEHAGGISTALTGGFRLSPPHAALANGAAAHALDFDDFHDAARVHAFCVVLPAALAAAEAKGEVSGKAFLTAVALGVEVFCRLGLTCHNSIGKGWHPTTALGTIAAAAAASKIFALDSEHTVNALGLAFMQLGGTTQSIPDGALSKRMGPGFAARSGVLSVHLARAGVTGPWRFLEGAAGLFALHERGEVAPERLLEGFGQEWRLSELSMKPYPCCRCSHTAVQIGIELHQEGVKADDIESGEIILAKVNRQIVGAPFDPVSASNPVVHAQFNACYAFARALRDGFVDFSSLRPDAILAPEMAVAKRFSCDETADFEPTAMAPARIRLVRRDGRVITRSRDTMMGSPEEAMSEQERLDKFRACLEYGLAVRREEADRYAESILGLDRAEDVRYVAESFPRPAKGPH